MSIKIPKWVSDVQSYVESRPYGSVALEITIVNRKVTQIATQGGETLRYTDTEAALADVNAILKNLVSVGYSGNAHIECTYKDGQISLLTIHDKKQTRY